MKLQPAVVLVAERSLMGRYRVLFEGIFATMQTTSTPGLAMRRLISPPVSVDKTGRASVAPLGLRRVEAALLGSGMSKDQVVLTTPEALPKLLGPWTRVVAVSSSDPLGRAMSNTTTAHFCGGELYSRCWTARMMEQLVQARRQQNFSIIGGGAGAWQWAQDPIEARRQGIDVIFEGHFESGGPKLVAGLLNGVSQSGHIWKTDTAVEAIRPIVGPSSMGVIELSRGCGNGCRFCTSAFKRMAHLPQELILSDLETNVRGGVRSVVSGSEDFFRYGAADGRPDFDALAKLLEAMRQVKGLLFMQIDHANISSVLQLEPAQLGEIRRLLSWGARSDFLWVNLGIESANGQLVKENCPGKLGPFRAEDWEQMALDAAERMQKAGFFPLFSIVLGLPGETPDDVLRTRRLVAALHRRLSVVFPIFHEPVLEDSRRRGEAFNLERMRQDHLELFEACYEMNFRLVPLLYGDNQRAGGVSWAKRALLRLLGRAEVFQWRRRFARIEHKLLERASARKL